LTLRDQEAQLLELVHIDVTTDVQQN